MANSPSLAKPGRSAAKFGDLRRRCMFLLLALVVYRIGAHIPVPGIDPDQLAKLFQSQSGGILGHVQHVLGRRAVALHDVRAGDHAVHFGVDHHAVAVDRLAAARSAEERKGRPVSGRLRSTRVIFTVRPGDFPGARHCRRRWKISRPGDRSGHGVPVDRRS